MEKIRRSILMGGGKTLLLGFALLVIALAATGCEQPDNNVADYITTADGTWEIYTAQGLLAWNAYVTTNGDYSNPERLKTNVVLLDNITLPAPKEGQTSNWTPVGYYNYSSHVAYYYAGTFDGGGHTISNLKINLPNTHDLGLFGGVAETAVVKDLTLSDVEISGAYYIGGITGNNLGTIENCSIVSGSVSGGYDVGGIVGYNGETISAYNTGEVSGTDYVGGIAGYNEGTILDCKTMEKVSGKYAVGGIAGQNDWTITACYNTGEVSGINSVGGIAGSNKGEISGCTNSANVIATAQQERACAGGINGYNYGNISTSCNEGSIKADGIKFACSGGIAGYNSGNITDTCNNGSVYAECKDGDTTSGVEIFPGSYAGGIVGFNEYGTIKDSNNDAEVSATSTDLSVLQGNIAGRW